MSLTVTCSQCGSKLKVPESMLGKKGKCPKCAAVLFVAPTLSPATAGRGSSEILVDDQPFLNRVEGVPSRLDRDHLYLVLGGDRLVAYWRSNDGWQLKISSGFVNVRQENSMLPTQGEFILVQGVVRKTDNGERLFGMKMFTLGDRGNLTPLARSEGEILEKIIGYTPLNMAQKRHVLRFLRDRFFPTFTEEAPEVIEYLLGEDFHSTHIGDCSEPTSAGLMQNE